MIISVKELNKSEYTESVLEIVTEHDGDFEVITNIYHVSGSNDNWEIPVVSHVGGRLSFNEDGTIVNYEYIMRDIASCFAIWNEIRGNGNNASKPFELKIPNEPKN